MIYFKYEYKHLCEFLRCPQKFYFNLIQEINSQFSNREFLYQRDCSIHPDLWNPLLRFFKKKEIFLSSPIALNRLKILKSTQLNKSYQIKKPYQATLNVQLKSNFNCLDFICNTHNLIYSHSSFIYYHILNSKGIKKHHDLLFSYIYKIFQSNSINIKSFYVILVNPIYRKKKNIQQEPFIIKLINLDKIIKKTKRLNEVIDSFSKCIKQNQQFILESIKQKELSHTININTSYIGRRCLKQPVCEYLNKCVVEKNKNNISFLSKISDDVINFFYCKNIYNFNDLYENKEEYNKLLTAQKRQIRAHVCEKIYIKKDKIQSFLNQIKFPLYFIDFEAYQSPIPNQSHILPFEFIPFACSIYWVNSFKDIINKTYLQQSKTIFIDFEDEPYPIFYENLKKILLNSAKIGVYGGDFEKNQFKSISLKMGDTQWYKAINSKIIDFWDVFRNFDLYHPEQKGRTGLKSVMNFIYNGFYQDELVKNGSDVNHFYHRIKLFSSFEKKNYQKSILNYCQKDTQSLIFILKYLKSLNFIDKNRFVNFT